MTRLGFATGLLALLSVTSAQMTVNNLARLNDWWVTLTTTQKNVLRNAPLASGETQWSSSTLSGGSGNACNFPGITCRNAVADDLITLDLTGICNGTPMGTIPTQLFQMTSNEQSILGENPLLNLIMPNCGLSGGIKADVYNPDLTENFENLDLSNNLGLGGSLPSEFANVPTLKYLTLPSTGMTGTVPTQWTTLVNLVSFDGSSNSITGTIPNQANYFSSLASLERLVLSGNQLSGTIPATLSTPSPISILFLDNNQLTGTIPTSLNALPNMSSTTGSLFLAGNAFSCPILDYSSFALADDFDEQPPCVTYTVRAITPASGTNIFAQTRSPIFITFSGASQTTSPAVLSATGFAFGTDETVSVSADVDVGEVYYITISFGNPSDFWHVDRIEVTPPGGSPTSLFYSNRGIDGGSTDYEAVRNGDFLEAVFQMTITTDIGVPVSNIYSVLRDDRSYQRNFKLNGNPTNGEVDVYSMEGFNLGDIAVVFLGHYKPVDWTVASISITKRGTTRVFNCPTAISKSTRPVPCCSSTGARDSTCVSID